MPTPTHELASALALAIISESAEHAPTSEVRELIDRHYDEWLLQGPVIACEAAVLTFSILGDAVARLPDRVGATDEH